MRNDVDVPEGNTDAGEVTIARSGVVKLTRPEFDDALRASATIVELLSHRNEVLDWWRSLCGRDLTARLIAPAMDPAILEEASDILRMLRMPSYILSEELYLLVARWAFASVTNTDVSYADEVKPLSIEHIDSLDQQPALRRDFARRLRELADRIESGVLVAVPLSKLYQDLRWYFVQTIAEDHLPQGIQAPATRPRSKRHREKQLDARRKARYLYLSIVGDNDGKRWTVEQLADLLAQEDERLYVERHTAVRNIKRWIAYMKRILFLKPPSI